MSDESAQLNTRTKRPSILGLHPLIPQNNGRGFEVRAFSLKPPYFEEGWLHKSLKMDRRKSKDVFFLATGKFPQGWG